MNQLSYSPPATARPTARGDQNQWLVALALVAVVFLPATVFYSVGASSQATGLALACVVVIGLFAFRLPSFPIKARLGSWLAIAAMTIFVVAAHLIVARLIHQVDFGRAFQSLLILGLMLVSAFFLAGGLAARGGKSIARAASIIRFLFVGAALLSILRIQPPNAGIAISLERSVFPFAEPSHFALAFTPFLLHACVTVAGWKRYAWIALGFIIAYFLQSLTLVVGATLVAVICLPLSQTLTAAAVSAFAFQYLDLDYFTSRLDFGERSGNISNLVYRQGWELIGDSINRTGGWGIGFQQLGSVPFDSPSADLVYRILLSDSNLRDGGFTAAKLLSELGFLGLAICIGYFAMALRVSWRLRAHALGSRIISSPALLFAGAMMTGFAIELLVRGLGYFSGSAFLALASVLVLWYSRDFAETSADPAVEEDD